MGKNRVAIYVFFEKKGIVREYVLTYLQGLQHVAERIIVVVNGNINKEGEKNLKDKLNIEVIQRPNEGVDFWAYKTGLEYLGDDVSKHEEIILANCSCYGPIYPFSEMFQEMSQRKVDFWGITEWPLDAGGYKGTWILSYFIVFRPRIFLSHDWKTYWNSLCPVYSREECIALHETKFTQYFADRGYQYDVYCHNSVNYIDLTIEAPDKLIEEMHCPIIKRKAFCAEYLRYLSCHRGSASKRALEYIQNNTSYDINQIYDDLLATQHYAYIKEVLHLNYFLPHHAIMSKAKGTYKVAVFFHVFYDDLLNSSFQYLKSMPEYADIYITSSRRDLQDKVMEGINKFGLKNASFHLVNSRGRADSAFLVHDSKFIFNYDFVCIAHDKKSSFLYPGCIGIDFGFHNLDSLLKSREYVENIISTFEQNPRIGVLEPTNLVHGNFMTLAGQEWGANYNGTVNFLHKAAIDVPISEDIPPIAPMGAMFWFRPDALRKLLDMEWEYEDFPPEPMPLDGAIIHIVERAIPFFAQDAGYLTGWVSSIEDAEVHLTNVYHLYRLDNITIANSSRNQDQKQLSPVYSGETGLKKASKNFVKKHMPLKLWIFCKKIYYKFGGRPV